MSDMSIYNPDSLGCWVAVSLASGECMSQHSVFKSDQNQDLIMCLWVWNMWLLHFLCFVCFHSLLIAVNKYCMKDRVREMERGRKKGKTGGQFPAMIQCLISNLWLRSMVCCLMGNTELSCLTVYLDFLLGACKALRHTKTFLHQSIYSPRTAFLSFSLSALFSLSSSLVFFTLFSHSYCSYS